MAGRHAEGYVYQLGRTDVSESLTFVGFRCMRRARDCTMAPNQRLSVGSRLSMQSSGNTDVFLLDRRVDGEVMTVVAAAIGSQQGSPASTCGFVVQGWRHCSPQSNLGRQLIHCQSERRHILTIDQALLQMLGDRAGLLCSESVRGHIHVTR
jgi:hypothetical protein